MMLDITMLFLRPLAILIGIVIIIGFLASFVIEWTYRRIVK